MQVWKHHTQIGRTERQGGILKEIIKSAVEEQQIVGVQDMKMLVGDGVHYGQECPVEPSWVSAWLNGCLASFQERSLP